MKTNLGIFIFTPLLYVAIKVVYRLFDDFALPGFSLYSHILVNFIMWLSLCLWRKSTHGLILISTGVLFSINTYLDFVFRNDNSIFDLLIGGSVSSLLSLISIVFLLRKHGVKAHLRDHRPE